MPKSTKTRLPISSIESELITILEFVRVALKHFPKATDRILTHMDLADEAFVDELRPVCDAVGFDFTDPKDDEEDD